MKTLIRFVLPIVVSTLLAWLTPSAIPLDVRNHDLADLLPESTVAAVELRGVDGRWDEIRGFPGLAAVQDRLLERIGLRADDLPRLAADRAVLALVLDGDRRDLLPIALLRPPRDEQTAALLEKHAGESSYVVRRGGNAVWLAPAGAEDWLERVYRDGRAGHRENDHLEELERRLPDGGLARGWINPRALRELLLRHVEGTLPPCVEWLSSMAAVKLETVRSAGFRRDLTPDGVVTDALVAFHSDVLPVEVTRALRSKPAPARLPLALPPGVVALAAFRTEPEAHLAWLRHVSMRDPRGSLRNLDFWIEAFEERTNRVVEHDLPGLLGGRGWAIVFESETDDAVELAIIVETRDAEEMEDALLDLRAFLMDHMLGRSLGLVAPRARDVPFDGRALHGTTLRTLFGEIEGPVFLVTDEHALLATGDRAVRRALDVLEDRTSWKPVMADVGLPYPAHEALRVRVSALTPLVDEWIGNRDDADAADLAAAATELISNLDAATLGVWYEDDAVRLRGHVRLASR